MMKSSFGKAFCLLVVSVLAAPAVAHLNMPPPFAAVEYNAAEAQSLHGEAEDFSKTDPTHLRDVEAGSGTYWLSGAVTELAALRGYAHIGSEGMTQQEANANVMLIQIWGWRDTNGNGAADDRDTTTEWKKLLELTPSANDGDGSGGNVVGYDIPYDVPAIPTSTWQGDLLQGRTIPLKVGESLLLLIRVVDISGNVNLMAQVAGLEQWDNGVADGVGSDVGDDRYVDADGNTPGTTDGRIHDDDVVWLYVPRLR